MQELLLSLINVAKTMSDKQRISVLHETF